MSISQSIVYIDFHLNYVDYNMRGRRTGGSKFSTKLLPFFHISDQIKALSANFFL